jgi:tRNA-2-methylthio-N6-dimethylallyladenosine synthase
MNTYFIKTFGCQMNFSDSERIMSFLEQKGFAPAMSLEKADLAIFNTCGVRQTAENRVYGQVHNLRLKNSSNLIVITGCLAHRTDVQQKLQKKADLFLSIREFFNQFHLIERKITTVNKTVSPKPLHFFSDNNYFEITPKYKHPDQAFVPIMTGCNNFCSYCVVPYARGPEWSRPVEDIFQEIKCLYQRNCQEVLLLGQNVNSYQDSSCQPTTNFPSLLNRLAKEFPTVTFRFLTSHPKDFSDKLIRVIARHQNIPKEIHLPIQAGSDKVLKDMNRPYTQLHYLKLVAKIKKAIPAVRLTTDVIVGFPTETEKDFLETVKVFQVVNFYEAFINKYSPRPGTAAEKLGDPVSWEEKKRREKILRALLPS